MVKAPNVMFSAPMIIRILFIAFTVELDCSEGTLDRAKVVIFSSEKTGVCSPPTSIRRLSCQNKVWINGRGFVFGDQLGVGVG